MVVAEPGRLALLRRLFRRPWGGGVHPSGRNGPRIAVIGNCQARGVARALDVLLPHAVVTLIPAGGLGRRRNGLEALAARLKGYDHVFSQPLAADRLADGGSRELVDLLPQARLFPAIVFAAFHPDMVYVGNAGDGRGGGLVPSPLHTYHSAITLFGYLRGLSADRIIGLFREETFAALGYLDGWWLAADDLVASSRAIGFDLGPELTGWSRRGTFMHGINHPRLMVLATIAARLAREAGLAPAEIAAEAYLTDDLLDEVIWPIYPPIAAVYGVGGSYTFKRRGLPKAVPSLLDLAGFVDESLALYPTIPRERLTCHRVQHWAGVPAIHAVFDAA